MAVFETTHQSTARLPKENIQFSYFIKTRWRCFYGDMNVSKKTDDFRQSVEFHIEVNSRLTKIIFKKAAYMYDFRSIPVTILPHFQRHHEDGQRKRILFLLQIPTLLLHGCEGYLGHIDDKAVQ